jgi:hypothetical protein
MLRALRNDSAGDRQAHEHHSNNFQLIRIALEAENRILIDSNPKNARINSVSTQEHKNDASEKQQAARA